MVARGLAGIYLQAQHRIAYERWEEVSGHGPERIKEGDEVKAIAGRYEGRTGVVTKILQESAGQAPGALALVTFSGGSANYCLMSHLEKVKGADSPPEPEEGGGV